MSAEETKKEGKNSGGSGGRGGSGGGSSFRSLVILVLILCAVLGIVAMVAVRTKAFRDKTQDWLGKKTGLPVKIEATRMGWPFCLVVKNLVVEPAEGESWQLNVEEVRLQPAGSRMDVKLSRCALVMVKDKAGNWLPDKLSAVGELRDIGQVGALTLKLRQKVNLEINRGSILWLDSSGAQVAELENFDFKMTPFDITGGRKIYYCALRVYGNMTGAGGVRERDIFGEWIVTEQNRCIELEWKEAARTRDMSDEDIDGEDGKSAVRPPEVFHGEKVGE